MQLLRLARQHPSWGFWRLFRALREAGYCYNHKRIYRIYKALKLNHRLKAGKVIWSLCSTSYRLCHGKDFFTLFILRWSADMASVLHVSIETRLSAPRIQAILEQVSQEHGLPETLECCLPSNALYPGIQTWCREKQVNECLPGIRSSSRQRKMKAFFADYRSGVIDYWMLTSLDQVHRLTLDWVADRDKRSA